MEPDVQLKKIVHDLEQFFKENPGHETDGITMILLMNIVHQQFCSYVTRPKRYVFDVREADSDTSVREIMKRKNSAWGV